MTSLRVSAQSCRLWRGQETLIPASQVLIEAAVLVMFLPMVMVDVCAAKVFLKFVVEAEVADGVIEEVHLVHDSSLCGCLTWGSFC